MDMQHWVYVLLVCLFLSVQKCVVCVCGESYIITYVSGFLLWFVLACDQWRSMTSVNVRTDGCDDFLGPVKLRDRTIVWLRAQTTLSCRAHHKRPVLCQGDKCLWKMWLYYGMFLPNRLLLKIHPRSLNIPSPSISLRLQMILLSRKKAQKTDLWFASLKISNATKSFNSIWLWLELYRGNVAPFMCISVLMVKCVYLINRFLAVRCIDPESWVRSCTICCSVRFMHPASAYDDTGAWCKK